MQSDDKNVVHVGLKSKTNPTPKVLNMVHRPKMVENP